MVVSQLVMEKYNIRLLVGCFVLRCINRFRVINAELSHFGWVWFYGIIIIVGYLMKNQVLYI